MAGELAPLAGGTLQKVRQPGPLTLVLELRLPGETVELLVSAEPGEGRLHLTSERLPAPQTPFGFQGLLRSHLLPSRLAGIEAVPGDRIVELRFDTTEGQRTLVAELTGRTGNLALLAEDRRVLGAALAVAGGRRLPAGKPYERPELRSPQPPRSSALLDAAGTGRFSMSIAADAAFGPVAREQALDARRREAGRTLEAALARTRRTREKIAADAARAGQAEELRIRADLLKTALGTVPRGAKSVTATDWSSGEPREVTVPLRPELSARDNLEKLYTQYRRLSGARAKIEARQQELAAQEEALLAGTRRLAAARSEAELDEAIRAVAAPEKGERRKVVATPARPPYRAYQSATGSAIWVGRGAQANDRLTFRVAKPADLWLHARGVPGAHVVVPLPRGTEPDPETLADACALAVHHSGFQGERVADVTVTRVRHLRRPRGAAPGTALVDQEEVRAVRLDEARLSRLLAQAPA